MNEQLKIIISAEVSKFKAGVEEAKSKISSFKDEVKKASDNADANIKKMGDAMAKAAVAIVAAATAAATALYKIVTGSAAACDEIDKMSQKIGISKQAYQEWNHICTQSGVDVNIFQNGMKSLVTAMDNANSGSQTAIDSFSALGLTWLDSAGNLKTQEQMMEETIAALASMEDGTERARLAQELFGRAGTELAPILNSGVEGIEALRTEAHDLGLVLSDEAVAAGVQLTDTMANVKNSFNGVVNRIGVAVMPYFQQLCDKVIEVMPQIEEAVFTAFEKVKEAFNYIQEHQGLFTAIAAIIATVVTAIGLYNAVAAVKAAMDAAQVTTLGALIAAKLADAAATAVALAPYLLIVAAIAAVIAIIVLCVKHWDTIKEAVATAWEWIKEKTMAAVDAVVNFFTGLWDSLTAIVDNIKTAISEKWDAIKTAVTDKCEEIKQKAQEKWDAIKTAVSDKCSQIKENASEKWANMKENISNTINLIKDIATNIFENIKANIQSKLDATKALVTTIFDGIKASIQNKIETAKAVISNVLAAIKAVFSGDLGAAKQAVLNIFESIKTGIQNKINNAKTVVQNAINAIKGFFNFSWSLPHLKLPHFTITGNFSLNPPSIPKFSVSWYEMGGVFDMPTLFGYGNGMLGGLGENGAEAVVPLENNTYWLDRLATMLNEKQGGNQPIILQVDGKTFAETSIESINALTRQRGSLALNLV